MKEPGLALTWQDMCGANLLVFSKAWKLPDCLTLFSYDVWSKIVGFFNLNSVSRHLKCIEHISYSFKFHVELDGTQLIL